MDAWIGVGFIAGAALGAALAWIILRLQQATRIAAAVTEARTPIQTELATLKERNTRIGELELAVRTLEGERDAARSARADLGERNAGLRATADRLPGLQSELKETADKLEAANRTLADLKESFGRQNAELTERLAAEDKGAAEKLALLEHAKDALSNQFKTLANDILDEKSKRFTEQNQTNLNAVLDPLRTKLREFQDKVEQVHIDGGKERFALTVQVRQLVALNQTLSEDAKNLTSALKGSAKSQGTWGELILERILETAGLQRGREYVAQELQSAEDGRRLQPDVVIFLPEERHLVVDSKVSLVAYERCASTELEDERVTALKQHLESVRNHVKALGDKNYQDLYKLKSLDFVLLFVPIEPAFMLAIANDRDLLMNAWRRNVLLVSPSTLLFVVRTVAHLWRQEAQSRNVQEIAARGAELYNKLAGFASDLSKVGDGLKSAQGAYEDAHKKFCEGRGNVIRQAEMLRDLGVKPAKHLPRQMLERSLSSDSMPLLADLADSIEASTHGDAPVVAEPVPTASSWTGRHPVADEVLDEK